MTLYYTHVKGDGSDHADVAANTTKIDAHSALVNEHIDWTDAIGHRFVDRGDPDTFDWHEIGAKDVFITDGTWHDLDCSSIVPTGAVAILFVIALQDNAIKSDFFLRKNGNINNWTMQGLRSAVANVYFDGNFTVPCDSNQVVEYRGTNISFTDIYLTIVGWWI